MIFDGWDDLARILVIGVTAYAALIAILRASGKRTLSKMNAFDLVVTVAFGSTLSASLLDSSVSLSEAVLAFAVLAALQYAITFASVRSERIQSLFKASPTLVFRDGAAIEAALRDQRVTREEILAAIRAAGHASTRSVAAVVLETDGSFSVLARSDAPDLDVLASVRDPRRGGLAR